jgi:hypothetical protein
MSGKRKTTPRITRIALIYTDKKVLLRSNQRRSFTADQRGSKANSNVARKAYLRCIAPQGAWACASFLPPIAEWTMNYVRQWVAKDMTYAMELVRA